MATKITKSDINKIRLNLIKARIFTRYGTYDGFRRAHVHGVGLEAFRQWFKANPAGKFYISDDKLCHMETLLDIPPERIRRVLEANLPTSVTAMQHHFPGFRLPAPLSRQTP